MRGVLALTLVAVAMGCKSAAVPVSKETRAELPGSRFVTLPRLADDLDLDYRGDRDLQGIIELSAPPDHVMLVKDSTRALVNGNALSMEYPCMRRGDELVVTRTDANNIGATLNRLRSRRVAPEPIARPVPPAPPPRRAETLPAAWRPGPGVRARDWRYIVIHHTATDRGSAALINILHRGRGWEGLGYHFVVGNGTLSGDGVVETGYRWKRQAVGAHAKAPVGDPKRASNFWNEHSIGICLVGDFRKGPPSPRQMAALTRLIRALQAEYGIPDERVEPHRNVTRTLCPGPQFPWNDLVSRLR